MLPSVRKVCEALVRSRLLSSDEVRTLRKRWQGEVRDPGDAGRFMKWLVANQYVTGYQAAMLSHGHLDHFFLGPYKLLDRMGKGRLAVIYKALHPSGQVVALKVLPPSKARDQQVLARFQREAQLALRLNHPHVVRTLTTGEIKGLYFLVMEFLSGQTLGELLHKHGRLPAARTVELIYQALLGLQYIHESGMVHRNLEPANLMVLQDSGQVTVKILDLSLGRSLFGDRKDASGKDLRLTYERPLLGSPVYLAPEQARDAHTADIRADVYSIGCLLYHTLTGQPPFPDANPLSQVVRHATESPRPLRLLDPSLPEGLQPIIDRMMAKDPADRYPTPAEAAPALRAFQTNSGDVNHVPDEEPGPPSLFPEWPPAQGMAEAVDEPGFFPEPAPESTSVGASPPEDVFPDPQSDYAEPDSDWPEPFPSELASEPAAELWFSPATDRSTRRESAPSRTLHVHRRECLALVIGAVGLLLAEGLGWLLGRWFVVK